MENSASQTFNFRNIFDLVLKRRWFVIVPVLLSLITGIYLAVILPKRYMASTLILIQPQKVSTSYVQSIVTEGVDSRINTISQQILSRTNLEKIIKEFNLFSDAASKNIYFEDKIEKLRERISVEVSKDRKTRATDADAFSISFKGEDPLKVMRVVNTLGASFINENLKTREEQAQGTSYFLEEELVTLREHLEKLEANIKNYREKFMGALPEQLETNLRVLDRLQMQLTSKQEALLDAKNRLMLTEKQIAEQRQVSERVSAGATATASTNIETGVPVNPDAVKLKQLKSRHSDLTSKYTERHPDVVRLAKEIHELETKIEQQTPEKIETGDLPKTATAKTTADRDRLRPLLLMIQERDQLTAEIKTLNFETEKINKQSAVYQKRVEDTPKREQELLSLQRDYSNVKQTYDSLLSRKMEAQMAVNLEKKQKGEQFRIIDPARLPTKPIEPDMKKLFLLAVAAGLGLGAGLIFLMEYTDTSFKSSDDIEKMLGFPVLASIPSLDQKKKSMWAKLNTVLSLLLSALSLLLAAGFAVMVLKGVDQTVELVRSMI